MKFSYCQRPQHTGQYQFGCGISKMVGPKKEDFWPKVDVRKALYFVNTICQNLGMISKNKSVQKLKQVKKCFFNLLIFDIKIEFESRFELFDRLSFTVQGVLPLCAFQYCNFSKKSKKLPYAYCGAILFHWCNFLGNNSQKNRTLSMLIFGLAFSDPPCLKFQNRTDT